MLLTDYLIAHDGIDWSAAIASWDWLLPPGELTLWLVNRCGDLFFVFPDESVHMLDAGRGTLERVATNREDFAQRINDPANARDWLMMPLVKELVDAGIVLSPGQCYGYRKLPILGGDYAITNFAPISVVDFLSGCGALHFQLKDLPDGTEVRIKPE